MKLESYAWNTVADRQIDASDTGVCIPPSSLSSTMVDAESFLLAWDTVTVIKKFQVFLRELAAPGTQVIKNSTYHSKLANDLIPGNTYEWMVRSVCPGDLKSEFSIPQVFTVPLPVNQQLKKSKLKNSKDKTRSSPLFGKSKLLLQLQSKCDLNNKVDSLVITLHFNVCRS